MWNKTTCYTSADLSWFIFSQEDREHKTFNILPGADWTVALDLALQR